MKKGILPAVFTLCIVFGVWWYFGGQHWLAIHTGTVNEPGPYYGFWSGFGSDLGEYALLTGIFGHLALAWRQHTCAKHWWCWRTPHYPLEGNEHFLLCGHHHPDHHMTLREAIEHHKRLRHAKETADA